MTATPRAPLPKAYWQLTVSRVLSTFAAQTLAVVLGWSVYAESHSALALGFVGLAEATTALGLALWAGHVIDRGDAACIYRRSVAGHLFAALILLALSCCGQALSISAKLGCLYAVSLAVGAARAFLSPSLYVLLPRLVPRDQLGMASAYSSSALQLARVLGPAVGGLAYGVFGPSLTAAGIVAVLAASLLALRRLPSTQQRAKHPPTAAAPGALLEGVKYVFQEPMLLSALSLDMICVLFGGVTAVLPVFADEVLAAGPAALGWLRAAPALGASMMSLCLTRIDVRPKAGVALLGSVFGFGLCNLAFALSRSLPLSLALLWLSGAFDSISVLVRQLIVQLRSPESMRGRISAVNSMFIGSSNELGEFESGVSAWWLGLVPSVMLGAGISLLFVATLTLRVPSLRRLDLRREPVAARR